MQQPSARFLGNTASYAAFLTALSIYWLTCDPGVSYWDCPEYVTSASFLEIGHPPGNPVWMLAMRCVTIFFPPHLHSLAINLASGLLMAGAAFFLARIIYILIPWAFISRNGNERKNQPVINAFAAYGGATCFSLCDSTWFSAVEAEVYAMSAFFTALTVWLMLKAVLTDDAAQRKRMLVLISYLMGLSLGIHQLNLLAIPSMALIYIFFRKQYAEKKIPLHKVVLTLCISSALIASMLILLPGFTISFASKTELFFCNRLSLPPFSGVLASIAATLALFIVLIVFLPGGSHRQTGVWAVAFAWLGFLSFALIPIRSAAMPPLNTGNPSDIFSFARYFNRDQYGSKPLLKGATPFSKPMYIESFDKETGIPEYRRFALKKGKPIYKPLLPNARLHYRSGLVRRTDSLSNDKALNHGKYLLSDYYFSRLTTPELEIWLPRITDGSPDMMRSYSDWAAMDTSSMARVEVSSAIDSIGNPVGMIDADGGRVKSFSYRPTFLHNLRMLFGYQIGYMYFRYLLWNFMGRQNDIPSTGEIDHGNFLTGIPFADNAMLGDQTLMPPYASSENKGRNRLFGIPLLFGLVGCILLCVSGRNARRVNAVVFTLFFMTGIAIVLYLNQSPGEPRERDYSFLGSYMAFAIWIAFGFKAIAILTARWFKSHTLPSVTVAAAALGVPAFMGAVNYDDHDRSGRFETLAFARNIMQSTPRGIIFTQGDNFTFPLWHATDPVNPSHTVVDISYLATPEYAVSLMHQGNDRIPFIATPADVAYGAYAFTRIPLNADTTPVPLASAIRELYAKRTDQPAFRHSIVKFPSTANGDTVLIDLRSLAQGGNLPFRTLMLLDIAAANSERRQPLALSFLSHLPPSFRQPFTGLTKTLPFSETLAPGMSDSTYLELISNTTEIIRKNTANHNPKYIEPVVADQYRRQRGAMMTLARLQLSAGMTHKAAETVETALALFPYGISGPDSYAVADSAFNEALEAARLLQILSDSLASPCLKAKGDSIIRIMNEEGKAWNEYRLSLPPWRRNALSSSSRRKSKFYRQATP